MYCTTKLQKRDELTSDELLNPCRGANVMVK